MICSILKILRRKKKTHVHCMLLPVLIIQKRGVRYVYLVHFSFISKNPRFNTHLFGLNTAVVYFGYTKQV